MLTTRLTMMVVFAPPDLAFPVAHIGGVSKSKLAHQTPNTHDPCELTYSREAETAYCMKGRYQLANFAKFNRPDPMRDWDWENPSSINLYQYVRNNPIMTEDPTGLMPGLVGLIMANQMAEMASKTAARAAVQAAASQAAKKQGVKLAGKKTAGRVVSKFLGPVGAILGAADAGWTIGTYLNSKTGLSEILAEELHSAINGEPQGWVPQVYDDNNFEIQGLVPEASSDGEKVIEKNSVINGYSVSNHAWRKGGLGRGATEERVASVIDGANENENVTTTEGQGKFKGNTIKTYEHNGVKVTVDETRKVIISIRPSNNKEFRIMR